MPFGLRKAKRVNDSANIERQYYDRDFFGQSPQQHVSHTFEMASMRKAQAMKPKKSEASVWVPRSYIISY